MTNHCRLLTCFGFAGVSLLAASISLAQTAPRGNSPSGSKSSAGSTSKPKAPIVSAPKTPASKTPASKNTAPKNQAPKANAPQGGEQDEQPRVASLPGADTRRDPKDTRPVLPPGAQANGAPPPLPTPVAPAWHPVPADEADYIDDVLKFWENSTSKINNYRCSFDKYAYNPNFAPPGTYYEFSKGEIMYAKPDKGMYRVDEIYRYRPSKDPGGKPEHAKAEGEKGEHWICDGKAVFYFDHLNKLLRKTNLPPVLQGKAIADGPLPFVFGAEAKKIKERYWLHVVTPADSKEEIHLAAVPKLREDAANYKEIKIIIDHKEFLPKAMMVFLPGFHAKNNPAKENYIFGKRQNNLSDVLWLPLAKQFYEPSVPSGWKLEEQEVPRQELPGKDVADAPRASGAPVSPKTSAPAVPSTTRRPASASDRKR